MDSQDRAVYQKSVIINSLYFRGYYWVSWLPLTAGVSAGVNDEKSIFPCSFNTDNSITTFSIGAEKHNYKPLKGYVPDAETAISIAIAVWEPIYGRGQIQGQSPYTHLSDGIWTVTGSLSEDEVFYR